MADREDLKQWVYEALKELGGEGSVVEIAKIIWRDHETDLKASGDLFYRWQYEMRWAGQVLQQEKKLAKLKSPRKWRLTV